MPAWLTLLAVCVALTLYVEWHTDEVTVVLAVMLLCAVSLGLLNPPLAPVGGAVLGFSILAAHALTEAAGVLRPRYMHATVTAGDWAAMAIAGLVVTAVAFGAGLIRMKLAEA